MIAVLESAPMQNGFFPKFYRATEKNLFEKEVNMVDQALVAYYRAQAGYDTVEFFQFIQEAFERSRILYGKYDRQTKQPTVTYESPAVYGILIFYLQEQGEFNLAETAYTRRQLFEMNLCGALPMVIQKTHLAIRIYLIISYQCLRKSILKRYRQNNMT